MMNALDLGPVLHREPTAKAVLINLLTATGEAQQALFAKAREVRHAAGSDAVKVRGVIEISNYCQKHCEYCALRPQNRKMVRYRMDTDTILGIADQIMELGIRTVFMQAGQDPKSDEMVCEVIKRVKPHGVEVLLNLGEKPEATYRRYRELGADSYILKFETSSPELYQQIVGSSLEKRLQCARWIKAVGMRLGTGNIIGLPGQTIETLAEDLMLAVDLQPDFMSSSPFIPNEDTPLENLGFGDVDITLNSIALSRILFPTALIPAVSALEKIRPGGQLQGLQAGANVLTVNFTPKEVRDSYSIYSKDRFVVSLDHALKTIERAGLQREALRAVA